MKWHFEKNNYKENQLGRNDVHIWGVPLVKMADRVDLLSEMLSKDEIERASRFKFEKDKNEYISSRALLRTILSLYLKIEARQIQFNYGKYGKPTVDSCMNPRGFNFNMSHSHGFAMYAFRRHRKVGVDIERIKDISEMAELVGRFFTKRENAVFQQLSESEKKKFVFQLWTRKEAYVKCKGAGLNIPLDTIDVLSPESGAFAPSSKIDGWQIKTDGIYMLDLHPARGFSAACATEGAIYPQWIFRSFSGLAH